MMDEKQIKIFDKFYLFYEKYLNNIIVLFYFLISNIFYWLQHFGIGHGDRVSKYFATVILVPREGIIVTVAAVFIGIYFTIISILGAIKIDSTLAMLPKAKFFKLVTFIKNAFIFAFSYLIFTVFYAWLSEKLTDYLLHLLYLLLIILFFYMFLSALKVGLALFFVFKTDFRKFHESIEKEKKEKVHQYVILQRLGQFLNEQDGIKAQKKAIDMNEIMKRKNPPKK
jgi:hypothetical protein